MPCTIEVATHRTTVWDCTLLFCVELWRSLRSDTLVLIEQQSHFSQYSSIIAFMITCKF